MSKSYGPLGDIVSNWPDAVTALEPSNIVACVIEPPKLVEAPAIVIADATNTPLNSPLPAVL